MSSMDRLTLALIAAVSLPALASSAPVVAQDAAAWDNARADMVARAPTGMSQAISR